MKHLFIVNPAAGGKKGSADEIVLKLRSFAEGLREPFEIYVTKERMDACRKVSEEAEYSDKLYVYACGGDGTLNECCNGAAYRDNVAVTHYPCGTGNDFIKMFGKNDMIKFRDLNALASGVVYPMDMIDCNGRLGINICSVGIDARIGTDVHKYSQIPIIGGRTGYVVSLAVNMIKGVKQWFRIRAGDMNAAGEYSLICACNGRYYGGGFNPIPDAMPDDGSLDYLVIKGVSRLKMLQVVGKYAKGRFLELGTIATYIRGGNMEIEGDREFVVNIDGEAVFTKNVCFKAVPHCVNFIFPENIEYFKAHKLELGVNERKSLI